MDFAELTLFSFKYILQINYHRFGVRVAYIVELVMFHI